MNCCNMFIQITLLCKVSILNITFELFLFFMNCSNMYFQFALFSKVSITNVTFELFVSFMDCCNMFFQIPLFSKVSIIMLDFDVNLALQMPYSNGFFASLIVAMCPFLLDCFFPSWTFTIRLFKLHLNRFFPSWTVAAYSI